MHIVMRCEYIAMLPDLPAVDELQSILNTLRAVLQYACLDQGRCIEVVTTRFRHCIGFSTICRMQEVNLGNACQEIQANCAS